MTVRASGGAAAPDSPGQRPMESLASFTLSYACRYTSSYLRLRQSLSTKTLSIHRPLPSMLILTPASFGQRAFDSVPLIAGLVLLFVAVLVIVGGWYLMAESLYGPPKSARDYDRDDAVALLDQFIAGNWEFNDEFEGICGTKYDDPLMQQVADEWRAIQENFPPRAGDDYCSEEGWRRLFELRDLLVAAPDDSSVEGVRES